MAIDYQVFGDVSDVTLAGRSVSGVMSISIARRGKEVHWAGDGELYESLARSVVEGVSGTIVLLDPAQGEALHSVAGTMSFIWRDARGQGDKTVTISGVTVSACDSDCGGRIASKASLVFTAESADGVTDPVTIA